MLGTDASGDSHGNSDAPPTTGTVFLPLLNAADARLAVGLVVVAPVRDEEAPRSDAAPHP
jgi:hypothetical protein